MPTRNLDVTVLVQSVQQIKSDLNAVLRALRALPSVNVVLPPVRGIRAPRIGQVLIGRACEPRLRPKGGATAPKGRTTPR